jgi:3-phosphoshikimate 1-carboxyvinyltransferase
VDIDATESSQMLSALLMVAPLAAEPITVTTVGGVRWPFVRMTGLIMQAFQADKTTSPVHQIDAERFQVTAKHYVTTGTYAIEPDATAASYFAALPAVVTGATMLLRLGYGLQGDTAFLEVLRDLSVSVKNDSDGITVSRADHFALSGTTRDFSPFSDTFLTLAAIAPLLSGPTTITGIAHTRKQETDRVAGMVAELRRLGQEVDEHADGDGLTITPRPLKSGQIIETYHDHRFAMSFGILGCHDLHRDGTPWLTIDNPACCAKTFPNFFDVLENLRTR